MNEEQQPQINSNPNQSNPYYHQAQEERVSGFLSQTSPTKSLKEIDYILRGYMFNNEERKYIKVSDGIPDKIRLDFLQALTPHLSEDARITRLDRLQINGIMEFIIEWVVDYLDSVADGILDLKEYFTYEEKETKAYLKAGWTIKEISSVLNKKEETIKELLSDIEIKKEKLKHQKIKYEIEPLEETQMTKIAFIILSAVFYTILRSQEGVERDRIFKSLTLGENLSTPQMKGGGNPWWKIWK